MRVHGEIFRRNSRAFEGESLLASMSMDNSPTALLHRNWHGNPGGGLMKRIDMKALSDNLIDLVKVVDGLSFYQRWGGYQTDTLPDNSAHIEIALMYSQNITKALKDAMGDPHE
ncbi:hypothetical protein LCGC14_0378530 [marine sediment metagenome]|uniref:Uncharacterized protein n=1 Tax=marine sediment metagenome TaxID=412755 RepID=A0A0F9T2V0_9ZZZZ